MDCANEEVAATKMMAISINSLLVAGFITLNFGYINTKIDAVEAFRKTQGAQLGKVVISILVPREQYLVIAFVGIVLGEFQFLPVVGQVEFTSYNGLELVVCRLPHEPPLREHRASKAQRLEPVLPGETRTDLDLQLGLASSTRCALRHQRRIRFVERPAVSPRGALVRRKNRGTPS